MENLNLVTGIIIPYFNFAVFLVMFYVFFKGVIVKGVKGRRENFLSTSATAVAAKKEAEEKLRTLEKRLASLDSEISQIKSEAQQAATRESDRIIADAKKLAEFMKEESKRVIAAEIASARATLQSEIAESVRTNVESRLSKDLSRDQQLSILKKQTQEVKTLHAN